MRGCSLVILLLITGFTTSVFGQDATDTLYKRPKDTMDFVVTWKKIGNGVQFCETDAPLKSTIGDSKLTILKIDPKQVEFDLFTASAMDSISRPVNFWADTMNLSIVFNAGMYDLAKPLISRGLLKSGDHHNQFSYKEGWNVMFAMNPLDSANANNAVVYDMQCIPFDSIQHKYQSFAQGLRMLDCSGNPMNWKKNQSCSMLVCAHDDQENLIVIFNRSPFSQNQLIGFMKQFPTPLHNAIYMEGGPETSLYISIGDFCLQKVGSYVSGTYPKDTNETFWRLPNVIGIRVKK
ncbi:hypothetical protein [Fluviicola taffensis]|uniref:Phosphodiester glycosidase domain-containing protein n=1 Tax=Fluviicola taffensis (strain DSM 16823 / NCIMB 13979 / RW262) TaxID=755732 RepID=F2IHL6_FLUTR|nr:hypothetical protein [Fluviicola taffensis]AEA44794.1 hypothetical protein Fluta_2814 [Fluviicola taffensis DSM 16823]